MFCVDISSFVEFSFFTVKQGIGFIIGVNLIFSLSKSLEEFKILFYSFSILFNSFEFIYLFIILNKSDISLFNILKLLLSSNILSNLLINLFILFSLSPIIIFSFSGIDINLNNSVWYILLLFFSFLSLLKLSICEWISSNKNNK